MNIFIQERTELKHYGRLKEFLKKMGYQAENNTYDFLATITNSEPKKRLIKGKFIRISLKTK